MHIPVSKLFIWARLAAICINYVKLATELFSGPTSATPFAARARSNKRPFTAEPKTNFVSFFHCYTNFFSSCYTHTQQLLQTRRGATSDWGAECALAALNGKCWAGFCDLYLGIRDKILVPVGITTLFANAIHCEDINSLVHRSEY
jgi:hypothetical protein